MVQVDNVNEILRKLEKLDEDNKSLRDDINLRFNELALKISDFKNTESKVYEHSNWINAVKEVWSTSQMKESKDEIYKQKNYMTAAIAILGFIEIAIGIGLAVWK